LGVDVGQLVALVVKELQVDDDAVEHADCRHIPPAKKCLAAMIPLSLSTNEKRPPEGGRLNFRSTGVD
jgi:hypothetical protein